MRNSTARRQLTLFGSPALKTFPEGFSYVEGMLTSHEEERLVKQLGELPFKEFEYQGYLGKRRVVSFGWRYDFNTRELNKVDDIPAFLLPTRAKAAEFAGLQASDLQQALATEYAPGAGIGWHKDRAEFGDIIGISLLAPCTFRMRRKIGASWQRASVMAEPRSGYVMRGAARDEWQHSIPPVDALRYSITFRTFRESRG